MNTIHGLSEIRRMPRIGKVRLGIKAKTKSGKSYPKAVDHFVVQADKSTTEAAAEAFHEAYGAQARSLDIMFPTDDPREFFPQSYRRYGSSSGLICRGDGRIATQLNPDTGELIETTCDPSACEWQLVGHCRPIGSLQFLLPDVAGIGVWQIDTSSINSIINLNSGIDFVRRLTGGRIALLPLRLILRPREVQVAGKLKTIYVLDLAHEQLKLVDVLHAAKTPIEQLLLPPTDSDMPDELYPELMEDLSEHLDDSNPPYPIDNMPPITREQRLGLNQAAQVAGVSPDEASQYIQTTFNKANSLELTLPEYYEMLAWLERRSRSDTHQEQQQLGLGEDEAND